MSNKVCPNPDRKKHLWQQMAKGGKGRKNEGVKTTNPSLFAIYCHIASS